MSLSVATAPPADLAATPLAKRLERAGPAIQAILGQARHTIDPQRVYLFGSRATAQARPLSDIDLAFVLGDRARWGEFCAWVHEDAPTLLEVDLVDLDRCSEAVRQAVLSEGVLLYERST